MDLDIFTSGNKELFFNPDIDGGRDWPCYKLIVIHSLCGYAINYNEESYGLGGVKRQRFIDMLTSLDKYLERICKDNNFVERPSKVSPYKLEIVFYHESFIELFPTIVECRKGETAGLYSVGCTLVDRSKGTFPLVLYPGYLVKGEKKGDRLTAFKMAVKDILMNAEKIHGIVMKNSYGRNWSGVRTDFLELFARKKSA